MIVEPNGSEIDEKVRLREQLDQWREGIGAQVGHDAVEVSSEEEDKRVITNWMEGTPQ